MIIIVIYTVRLCEKLLLEKDIFINIFVNNTAIDPKGSKERKFLDSLRFENFSLDE